MANLQQEYIDAKNVTHRVEHLTLSVEEDCYKERIAEEVLQALTQPSKQILA